MPEKLKVKTRKLTSKNNRSQWSGHSLCIDGQVRLMSGKQPCLRKTGKVKAMYQEKNGMQNVGEVDASRQSRRRLGVAMRRV